MSTRIHKVLGYGVASGVDKSKMLDDIWENQKPGEVSALVDTEVVKAREEKRKGYISLSMEGSIVGPNGERAESYPDKFSDIVHYAEHPDSDNGWWVIVPPREWKSWYRRDNTLDYYESYQDDPDADQLDTVVKQLNVSIYPYSSWMNKDTGEILTNYSRIRDNNRTGGPDPDVVPWVPEVVQLIATHLQMPDWKLFRPVLIRWWS